MKTLVCLAEPDIVALVKAAQALVVDFNSPLLPDLLASLSEGVTGPPVHVVVAEQQYLNLFAHDHIGLLASEPVVFKS